ncbi:hypothetical protein V8F20_003610 [Naviculisporaceae sp. PSN 640]
MYHLPPLNPTAPTGGGRTRSNSKTTTTTTTTTSSSGWIPQILKKTVVHQDFRMEENTTQMSIVFNALPTSIQNRLPPIPSLRRRVTGRGAVDRILTSPPLPSSPVDTSLSSGSPDKPSALFRSPYSSGRTTPLSDDETAVMDISESDTEIDQQSERSPTLDGFPFSDARNLASSMSMLPGPATSDTGINWRCGAQGFGLVINSAQESRCRQSSNYNPCFERTSYIDGVQYMLQGLPRDLDPTEAAILRRSMPTILSESPPHYSQDDHHPEFDMDNQARPVSPSEDRNLIHSLLLFMLIYMKSWILWTMPYILLLSREVIQFEREHNVAGLVVNKCMAAMRASVQVVRAMSHGPLGQCVGSSLEYLAEGVSGALQEFARDWFAGKEKEFGSSRGSYGMGDKLGGVDGSGYGNGYGRQQQRYRQHQQQTTRGRTKVR